MDRSECSRSSDFGVDDGSKPAPTRCWALLTEEEMTVSPEKKLAELRDMWAEELHAELV
jgi:hypothetical protein